jgi:hypothetical protein
MKSLWHGICSNGYDEKSKPQGREMNIEDLAERIGAKIFSPQGEPAGDRKSVRSVYAGDRISELLNAASERTLLVTNLANHQLFRIAALMEVPGICLLNGVPVTEEMVSLAVGNGTAVLVSRADMFETCGRIYQCLVTEGDKDR